MPNGLHRHFRGARETFPGTSKVPSTSGGRVVNKADTDKRQKPEEATGRHWSAWQIRFRDGFTGVYISFRRLRIWRTVNHGTPGSEFPVEVCVYGTRPMETLHLNDLPQRHCQRGTFTFHSDAEPIFSASMHARLFLSNGYAHFFPFLRDASNSPIFPQSNSMLSIENLEFWIFPWDRYSEIPSHRWNEQVTGFVFNLLGLSLKFWSVSFG